MYVENKEFEDLHLVQEWYHATSCDSFVKIMQLGINAEINKRKELDFGSGFYLSPSFAWAREYAESFIETIDNRETDMVIIQFGISVPKLLDEGMEMMSWCSQSQDYAEFVLKNRTTPGLNHHVDFILGPMTDGKQLEAIEDYREGILSKEDVFEIFMKPTGYWQLLLHSQRACDMLVPTSAITLKGGLLDVSNYGKDSRKSQ